MTVTNKTSVALEILGGSLKPNESREYTEMMFNTLDIHSDAPLNHKFLLKNL